MDDFNIEDPRKTSAKQIKKIIIEQEKRKTITQYLFDLCIKTFLCISFLIFDFALFANAGNYKLFFRDTTLNPEVYNIIVGICVIVFILMFIASFINKLDNLIVATVFSTTFIAIINQFATFDKHSGLLILFGGIFSDKINAILYEYSLWIIFAITLLFIFYILNRIKRQYIFYATFISCAMTGWVISESYFNNETHHFKNIESSKTNIPSTDNDENFIYLAFKDLGSPNNLLNIRDTIKGNSNLEDVFYNMLGFYLKNDFTLYPNIISSSATSPFVNIAKSLNPEHNGSVEDLLLNNASKKSYFDLSLLQENKFHLKRSSVIEKFNKDGYQIKTYQTKDIDLCQLKNGIDNFSCNEKISIPTLLTDNFNTSEKTKILLSQWFGSSGFLPSVNAVLNTLNFVWDNDFTKPLNFNPNDLHVMNSLQIFDILIRDIESNHGKKAYFAAIDFPSKTYIYDDFCNIKPLSEWSNENFISGNGTSLSKRQQSYAQQLNCLIGTLESFIQKLKEKQYYDNTTIIIEGLNNPLGISPKYKKMYQNLQINKQTSLAIHKAGEQSSLIDYSFCPVNNVLSFRLFGKNNCEDLSHLNLSEKEASEVLSDSEFQKYNPQKMSNATSKFDSWFVIWEGNQNTSTNEDTSSQDEKETLSLENEELDEDEELDENEELEEIEEIEEAPVTDKIIEDVPEEKLQNISAAMDKTAKSDDNAEQQKTSIDNQTSSSEPSEKDNLNNSETISANDNNTSETNNISSEENVLAEENQQTQEKTAPQTEINTDNVPPSNSEEQADVNDLEKELENMATQKDVSTESSSLEKQVSETNDVIPETLFDENEPLDKIENSINKAKELIKEKEQAAMELQNSQPAAPVQSEEIRNILEAAESIEDNTTVEESAPTASNDINIQIKVVEN